MCYSPHQRNSATPSCGIMRLWGIPVTFEKRGEVLMKGIKIVLLFLIAAPILAASSLSAQELALPLDQKTVGPGCGIVKFDGVTYRIMTMGNYYLTFSRVDQEHHRVLILPAENETPPFCEIYLQWEFFPVVELDLEVGETNTYLLGTETGYVEK